MAQISIPSTLNGRLSRPEVRLSAAGVIGSTKRFLDITLSALGLALSAPLLFLIAAIIKATSAGPAIYRQTRVGLRGRVFTIYKFRTMLGDAEPNGPVWPREPYGLDPRCTPVGHLLRWSGLDELPQLINVLKGDMSLVGPRPERPEFAAIFAETYPVYGQRHNVRPGLTGLSQVRGLRGNTSIAERLDFDLAYVENWSFLLDAWILLSTLRVVLRGVLMKWRSV